YGTLTPVNQVANVSIPDPRSIMIQPWESTLVPAIEKAIMQSDLGLTPNSDGAVIRLNLPQLTQERRAEFVKIANKKTEEARVAIRNIRRDANDELKKLEKDKSVPEDELKKAQDDIQKLTDRHIKDAEQMLASKEKEILEV
ncbi:MAG: ribosome recycling factor, partial [Negativicutes bacterium]|nr:ribosome recycling factor [Negativicutes bacterium]